MEGRACGSGKHCWQGRCLEDPAAPIDLIAQLFAWTLEAGRELVVPRFKNNVTERCSLTGYSLNLCNDIDLRLNEMVVSPKHIITIVITCLLVFGAYFLPNINNERIGLLRRG
ncbi:uncharacterized protein LOC131933316 [Physella acuta]|uniref:uncharacterized protein LOC131933316 n=1 Tax=Physella acuta TaxID=109671 RepID=UPI0027DB5A7B|nr:uncharacterized protein LOC131933316 [Physella acuta]